MLRLSEKEIDCMSTQLVRQTRCPSDPDTSRPAFGEPICSAKDLGVDITAGGARRVHLQRARFLKVRQRADRLARARGPVKRKAFLSKSFLQTAALYGDEVLGVSEARMRSLRRPR